MNTEAKQIRELRKYHLTIGDSTFVYAGKCPLCGIAGKTFSAKRGINKCKDCLNEIRFKIKSKCHHCGKEYKMSAEQKRNGRKFCSVKCNGDYNKLPDFVIHKCDNCGKPHKSKRQKYKLYKHHYCSKKCQDQNRTSDFIKIRESHKNLNHKYFIYNGKCCNCNKNNRKYRTSVRQRKCCECINSYEKKYAAKKLKLDIQFKISHYLRKRIKTAIHRKKVQKNHKSGKIAEMVGCDVKHLLKHLESKFTSKMSWDNYGTYWHVDHIIPISSFDLTDPYQCKQANHWTNLQPLEAKQNIAKSNKIVEPQMNLMLNV